MDRVEEKIDNNPIVEHDESDELVSQLNMNVDNQFVVFSVGDEEFGVPILSVQEIVSLPSITRLPGAPDYMCGIINLRGSIIPLYILRKKFGLEEKKLDETTTVIIVKIENEYVSKTIGLIVDSVSDVISIEQDQMSDAPDFSSQVDVRYIKSIGKVNGRMVIGIDLNAFLSATDTLDVKKGKVS